jgi:electron transfer flavoprotein alpha subunit
MAQLNYPTQDSGKFTVKKTAFSGKAFATVELTSANKVIALTPNAYKVVANGARCKGRRF